jgi:glycosyltransferase involved in cell wall biosynthesis
MKRGRDATDFLHIEVYMNSPLVSVIMVTGNRSAYAKEAIDGILAQTLKQFEFIIINNASTDDTEAMIRTYTDPRIRYHKNDVRLPAPEAYNKAIALASAKYVMVQHDDDISYPERMSLQYQHMENAPNLGVCGGYLQRFGARTSVQKVPAEQFLRESLLSFNPYPDAIAMYNKEILTAHGIAYNEEYKNGYDHRLFCDIAAVAGVGAVPLPILRYRVHAEQMTETKVKSNSASESDRTHLAYFNTLGLKLSADEEELLVHWVLDVQRYRNKKELSRSLYERVAALIEKILQYNAQVKHWDESNLKLVFSHLWRKAAFRGLSGTGGAMNHRLYSIAIPSLAGYTESWLKFRMFKLRRLLHVEGMDLS